ncbi:unnamed protein product [Phyllotreta striolata]|uniref:Uncharacterized protein n=1 Tax=Phyllotreta striolata TaxID=444603 RepID=A0A9N9TIL7_PHYSR|nr:unnamed protein product [Phyllotreta striolata]
MSEQAEPVEDTTHIEDPNFYYGYGGTFNFLNGDVYEGDYVAHISGLVWREGKGTYRTRDGDIYSGKWYNDQIAEDEDFEITYQDGSKYTGRIVKSHYEGSAVFMAQEGFHVFCNFAGNKPDGEICMVDVKGREWNAQARDSDALLLPEHPFYNDISPRLGKGVLRIQKATQSLVDVPSVRSLKPMNQETLNKLEIKIFAKTKKTISNLKFENSRWYQNWMTFKHTYETVERRIKNFGIESLSHMEKQWLAKYEEFKKRYSAIMEARHSQKLKTEADCKLYELYQTEEFLPPVTVFTAFEKFGDDDYEAEEDGMMLLTKNVNLSLLR